MVEHNPTETYRDNIFHIFRFGIAFYEYIYIIFSTTL